MAEKTIRTDDISDEIIDTDTPRLAFSFAGTDYEIDLTQDHVDALAATLAPYTAAATKVKDVTKASTSTRAPSLTDGLSRAERQAEATAVRAWGAENGLVINPKGRIANEHILAYRASLTAPAEVTEG